MQPLRWNPGFIFHNATPGFRYDATGHLLLAVDAPTLVAADGVWAPGERAAAEGGWDQADHPPSGVDLIGYSGRPLLLLDATWRRLPQVAACVQGTPLLRGLPAGIRTAYPRVNAEGGDPEAGLATVEALYAALRLLGDPAEVVLADYRWKDAFLHQF